MRKNKSDGLRETEHLLRSPKNAERLLASLRESKEGKGEVVSVESVRSLRRLLEQEPKKK